MDAEMYPGEIRLIYLVYQDTCRNVFEAVLFKRFCVNSFFCVIIPMVEFFGESKAILII